MGQVDEKHIDRVLCSLAGHPRVAELFGGVELVLADRSYSDSFGQVDVLLRWSDDSESHVENKIDAEFGGPMVKLPFAQPQRYQMRKELAPHAVRTIVFAPEGYLNANPRSVAAFDAHVSFEEVIAAIREEDDAETVECREVLVAGLAKFEGAFDEPTTAIFTAWGDASTERRLPWTAGRTAKAGRLTYTLRSWPRPPAENDRLAYRKTKLSAKFRKGFVDIEIGHALHVLEDVAREWPELSVRPSVSAGSETLIIGRAIAPILIGHDQSTRDERIASALDIAEVHVEWWLATGEQKIAAFLGVGDRSG